MTTILALSPHLDDAVFSAGGTLARAASDGARVIIATLFTGNVSRPRGFALACQLDKGLDASVDYMALRREEDRAACDVLGAEAWHCPLLEAPHRGYGSAAALFAPPHEADDRMALRGTIQGLLRAAQPDVIFAPRAIGGHVDHVLVHRALRDVSPDARIFWWTDWPYADRTGVADPEAPRLGQTSECLVRLAPNRIAQKVAACGAYASQLKFQFGGKAAMSERISARPEEHYLTTN